MPLPQELVEDILRILTLRDLMVTSLVSQAWSQSSRKYLYQTVYIHGNRQRHNFLATLETLTLSNRQYIREVYLNAAPLEKGRFRMMDDLAIISELCPFLETFAIVRLDHPLLEYTTGTTQVQGFPVSGFVDYRFKIGLRPYSRMRRIGTLLKDEEFQLHTSMFHQLTLATLSEDQLTTQMRQSLGTHPPDTQLFPALQVLDLTCAPNGSNLDVIALAWLQSHCPQLRQLSIQNLRLRDYDMQTPVPVHCSVKSLVLKDVFVNNRNWLSVLASIYPGLHSLSLGLDITSPLLAMFWVDEEDLPQLERAFEIGMMSEIVHWIESCESLTTLSITSLGETSMISQILAELFFLAKAGEWTCRLKHFYLDNGSENQAMYIKTLLEAHALFEHVETLSLSMFSLRYEQGTCVPEDVSWTDFSCELSPMFPPCNLAPDALKNITSLCLHHGENQVKTSLGQLLSACPKLQSLVLSGIAIQHIPCQNHISNLPTEKFNLTELVLDQCTVGRGDRLFSFLEHQLPRISSLTLTQTYFFTFEDLFLDLDVVLHHLQVMGLPPEIIQQILQHLSPQQLFVTALVSRSWSQLSLLSIYGTVHIYSKRQRKRFMGRLDSLPLTYCHAIQAVYLDIMIYDDLAFQPLDYSHHSDIEDDAIAIADKCPHLQTIALVSINNPCPLTASTEFYAHGIPLCTEFNPNYGVDLPFCPFARHIGLFLGTEALLQHRPAFHQLTSVSFTNGQTLHLGALLSVKTLELVRVEISNENWLPLLSSIYPSLTSISISLIVSPCDVNSAVEAELYKTDGRGYQLRINQQIIDWIAGYTGLISLNLGDVNVGNRSVIAEIVEGLIAMAGQGAWNCALQHFSLDGLSYQQRTWVNELLKSRPFQQLNTLHIWLFSVYHRLSRVASENAKGCTCILSTVFPQRGFAPDVLAHLTSLCLTQGHCSVDISLNRLLKLCTNLKSLEIKSGVLVHDVCPRHFLSPDTSKYNLKNLFLDDCEIMDAGFLFSLIQHQLPQLSRLSLTRLRLHLVDKDPVLSLDIALQYLCVALVTMDAILCTCLWLHEESFEKVTRYVADFDDDDASRSTSKNLPYNAGHQLHVRCAFAERVHFLQTQ
ncbi:hypothetical protein DM01DRAFT_1408052 [Hesseltinella vesiculosa]|uniref:F-box domain-containing protein n=1 Tax=Hesseltinella vesiculosa TaxID=101127 RepID=A0A1X2GFN4_9FUNG|nr:hypothetical protein DM01DRAFT_1408052 [Hesseltinella vesiculosa]